MFVFKDNDKSRTAFLFRVSNFLLAQPNCQSWITIVFSLLMAQLLLFPMYHILWKKGREHMEGQIMHNRNPAKICFMVCCCLLLACCSLCSLIFLTYLCSLYRILSTVFRSTNLWYILMTLQVLIKEDRHLIFHSHSRESQPVTYQIFFPSITLFNAACHAPRARSRSR